MNDLETLVELKTSQQYIAKEIDYILMRLASFEKEIKTHEHQLWENRRNIADVSRETSSVEQILKKTPLKDFFKNNWWKLLPFIIAVSTLLGWVGEYLYKLSPK